MNHTTITVKQARALVLVAPKDNTRGYLNGALFDFANYRAVATDGHCLLAINLEPVSAGAEKSDIQAIVPRDALAEISKGGKVDGTIAISADADTFRLVRLNEPARPNLTGKLLDGRYPDYTRVMPRKVSGELAQFGAQLMARIDKALLLALDLDKGNALSTVGHNGEKAGAPVFVHGYSNKAIGICMPARCEGSSDAEMLVFFSTGEPEKVKKAA